MTGKQCQIYQASNSWPENPYNTLSSIFFFFFFINLLKKASFQPSQFDSILFLFRVTSPLHRPRKIKCPLCQWKKTKNLWPQNPYNDHLNIYLHFPSPSQRLQDICGRCSGISVPVDMHVCITILLPTVHFFLLLFGHVLSECPFLAILFPTYAI